MSKKVLVVGGGGREHALAWKLSQSPQVSKIYISPGNGGTALVGKNVEIGPTDKDNLLSFAKEKNIDLTVIGQEAASEGGVVDLFKANGLAVFGPSKSAAKIESSKTFSKDLMKQQNIPTANYRNFNNPKVALTYIKSKKLPLVIKADGLAAGKGVVIVHTLAAAKEAINDIMVKKSFGESGNKVVVEDFLSGQEVSMHAICDGKTAVMFPPSQDHKQIYDNDKGPNTGGMGVIAPLPWLDQDTASKVEKEVVLPALDGLRKSGAKFSGCLYPGLMIDKNAIKVLEFNARFGDPEAEVYMRLLEGDFYQILHDCAAGRLKPESVRWRPGFAVSVVLASAGYPGKYQKGVAISGIEAAEKLADIVIFHAGTTKKNGKYATAGGRVLNVTATSGTLDVALAKAYQAVKLIRFEGMQYRSDIGQRQVT